MPYQLGHLTLIYIKLQPTLRTARNNQIIASKAWFEKLYALPV